MGQNFIVFLVWFLITLEVTGCGGVSHARGDHAWVLTIYVPRMTEWETAAPAVAETPDIKLFGKWSTDDVQINDISLQVRRDMVIVPPTLGLGHMWFLAEGVTSNLWCPAKSRVEDMTGKKGNS